MLGKLERYGFRGITLKLLKSYLFNRFQRVKLVNDKGEWIYSDLKPITCRVTQGSVLGPLLFLLYVNDLQKVSPLFHLITFADDTNLFMADRSISTLEKNKQ